MQTKKLVSSLALSLLVLGLTAGSSWAQETKPETMQKSTSTQMQNKAIRPAERGRMGMEGMGGMRGMHRMMGRHMMPATVTSIDKKTGLLGVNAEGMDLRLHFPPESLADVKKDDKITVMMAFRIGETPAMQGQPEAPAMQKQPEAPAKK